MTKSGLTGGVLGHSLSAVIHRKLYEIKGRKGEYELYETSDLDKTFKETLSKLDSFNITIPYKQDIMKYLDYTDETALMYNACNFVLKKEGRFFGYNTDADGFLYALMSKKQELKGKRVLVSGAGGVSHMLAATSVTKGAEVTLHARNEKKSEELSKFVYAATGKTVKIYNGEDNFDMLLQGTPAGMYPNYFDSPLPLGIIKNIPFVFDTIYNPEETLTIAVSRYFGNEAESGLSMLVYQAVRAHEISFNVSFSKEETEAVYSECLPYLHKTKPDFNIILTGAPGCGKTTVSRELASLTGGEVVDLDAEIERDENRSISEIFSTDGEDYFRNRETEMFKKALCGSGKIISTGGGIVERNDILSMKNEKDISVYINTPFEVIKERVKNDISRPLLSENAAEKLQVLMKKRKNMYISSSDIQIRSGNNLKDDVVSVLDEIVKFKRAH